MVLKYIQNKMPKFNKGVMERHVSRNMAKRTANQAADCDIKQNVAEKRRTNSLKNDAPQKKRMALGDLTNAIGKSLLGDNCPLQNETKKEKAKLDTKMKMGTLGLHVDAACRFEFHSSTLTSSQGTISSSQESTTSDKYMTASEESIFAEKVLPEKSRLPDGVTDIDQEASDNPLNAPEYAMDIFAYYKDREEKFMLKPYLQNQPRITCNMRAILVDWLVELQENFELNHETLYLSVKLLDQFLEKEKVPKERLQLLGAATVLIACKYEERMAPPLSDFLYVCDNAYTREELLQLEMDILRTVDFELGAPLSYRFLRRYSKSAKLNMSLLTLARYVLELSLHDYLMVFERESLKAAAALFLALRMNDLDWSPQLEYYSGYKKCELLEMARRLNAILHHPLQDIKAVRNKYSHRVFFEVAKIALLPENCSSLQDG